jgi:hypothetical protein
MRRAPVKVDIYNYGSKYLFVLEGRKLADVPFPDDFDPELRNLSSLLKSSVDISSGFTVFKGDGSELADFDAADIVDQIEAEGYATQTAVTTDAMIPPKPPNP